MKFRTGNTNFRLWLLLILPVAFSGLGPASEMPQGVQAKRPVAMKLSARQAIPGTGELQLIIELDDPSVSEAMQVGSARGAALLEASAGGSRGRIHLDSSQVSAYRAQLGRAQGAVADGLRTLSGVEVQGSTDLVLNSIIARVPIDQYRAVQRWPGVKKVFVSRQHRMLLDAAAVLHDAPALWARAGSRSSAGQGVKIGVIDSGIDINNAMFQDATTILPAGYPKGEPAYTNHKVIVARNYISLLSSRQSVLDARDEVGHGSFVAGCAAGKPVQAPLGPISGMAPGAFLGSYKVFGTPGINDSTTTAAIVTAINDAVADGMDILNLSLGALDYAPPSETPEVIAINNAIAAGLVVSIAAGNEGPDTNTIGTPASAPQAIAAGAVWNARVFAPRLHVTGPGTVPTNLSNLAYRPGTGPAISVAIPATPATDVASLDGTGLACSALPAGSLSGRIALIERGSCNFVDKVTFAANAGARAVVVYNNIPGDSAITMGGLDATTVPAVMMFYADGLALKRRLADTPGTTISMDVSNSAQATPIIPVLASGSSRGPAPDSGLKPDLVAAGWSIYSAAQTANPAGVLYDATGFTVASGTSFSTPMVSGAAAAVQQLFPTLTPAGIKSVLANTAGDVTTDGITPATVVQAGSGLLDMGKASTAGAIFSPTSLNFGAQAYADQISVSRTLVITNISGITDEFALSFQPVIAGPDLILSAAHTGPVARDGSTSVDITIQASAPLTGGFQGFVLVQSKATSMTYKVPYWAGLYVPDPSRILTVSQNTTNTGAFRSLADALAAANPGNIIEIADSGRYAVPSPDGNSPAGIAIGTNAQGLPLHQITIRAASGQTPVLDGTATTAYANLMVIGVRGVLIQGLTILGGETGIDLLQPSADSPAGVTIDHCLITNQRASTSAIGVYAENGGDVEITYSTIAGSAFAGIVVTNGARLTMSHSTVRGNSNAGIEAFDSNVDLMHSTLSGNLGVGAYLLNCTGTLANNTFGNNTGPFGDGIEIGDGSLTVTDNTFDTNGSAGMYLFSETVTGAGPTVQAERNVFQSNGDYGVRSDQALSLRMIANLLKDNGLGFRARGTTQAVLINNIIVRSNSATQGNGIDAGGASAVRLVNNTIDGNSLHGIALAPGAALSMANTIVSHSAGGDLSGLAAGDMQYSLVGDGTLTNATSLQGDPKFTSPGTDDFSLSSGSPAIDAGSNAVAGLPFLDYSRRLRVNSANALPGGGIVDLGAMEAGSFYPLDFPLLLSGPDSTFGDTFITGFAILNPSPSDATQATFAAYDPAGTLISGQGALAPRTFAAEAQVPILDFQLAGFPMYASRLGTVLATSVQKLAGFFLLFDQNFSRMADGVDVSADTWTDFFLMRHVKDATARTTYVVFNPGANSASVTATLMSASGSQLADPKTSLVAPKGQSLFDFSEVAAAGGYVRIQSDRPVTGLEVYGDSSEIAALGAAAAGTETRLFLPHIAVNQGYTSLIGILNPANSPAELTLTAYGNDGSILGVPTRRTVLPRGQLLDSASALFGLNTRTLITGYVIVSSNQAGISGFCAIDYDNGAVHARAAVPCESLPQQQLLFSHVAHQVPSGSGSPYQTGIALLNPFGVAISYTMQVFDGSGAKVAETTGALAPHGKVAKILSHPLPGIGFFTQPITLANGHIEVTTDYQLLGFELFYTESLSEIAAVPAQHPGL